MGDWTSPWFYLMGLYNSAGVTSSQKDKTLRIIDTRFMYDTYLLNDFDVKKDQRRCIRAVGLR
jgi:hypothetical protein